VVKITCTVILFSWLCLISPISFGAEHPQTSHQLIVAKLNEIISTQKYDQPGVSVLVKQGNEIIFKLSKGLANKHKNVAIISSTGFRIGSISKPFTALAIMKLVEQQRLSLLDPVTQFIPELPSSWQGIRIQDLLSHRVYLSKDFFSNSNLHIANLSTNRDLIRFLASKQVNVKPLSHNRGRYCNTCYVLLAEIITKASGVEFADYLRENIFIPANMEHSYIVEEGVSIKPKDALNYGKTDSFFGIKQYTTGAMAQVSSIEDLNNFILALKQNKIVSSESLSLMTKVHAELGDDGSFGLGWMIGRGDAPFFAHGGSQDGYQAELFLYPKHDIEVVMLSNGGDNTYALQAQVMRAIMTHYQ
jgi:CubicO group peptidase (beta-lactamase class C family)